MKHLSLLKDFKNLKKDLGTLIKVVFIIINNRRTNLCIDLNHVIQYAFCVKQLHQEELLKDLKEKFKKFNTIEILIIH